MATETLKIYEQIKSRMHKINHILQPGGKYSKYAKMIQLSKISQWSKEENLYDYVIDAEKYI
jgi:hypothetical protein